LKAIAISQPYNNHQSLRSFVIAFLFVSIQILLPSFSHAEIRSISFSISGSKPEVNNNSEQQPEARLQSTIKKTKEAFDNKRWEEAINFGENALKECSQLFSERDRRCIRIMKNNSMSYFRAGELEEHAANIESAYRIASKELGAMHFSTIRTREVFHQLLLDQVRYKEAIPVVIELIEAERQTSDDEYKVLDWLIQLYALYKIEGFVEQEIPILLEMTALTEKLLGEESDQLSRTRAVLTESYCEQKQYHDFYELKRQYKIKTKCKLPIRKRITLPFFRKFNLG
jgi:tetratricopeptide (TPR) repeat protein